MANTTQFFDAETIDVSSTDWVPSKQGGVTSGINCRTSGTLYVNCVGFGSAAFPGAPGGQGGTNVPITMVAGETIQLAIVKALHASSTGTYTAVY
jgi:hypothetical protein